VRIVNPLDGSDEILSANTDILGADAQITADYANGLLRLTGADTVANYQRVLRTIRYSNTAASPTRGTRTIVFSANDGVANSNTAITSLTVYVGSASKASATSSENATAADHVLTQVSGWLGT
jgi:hypothetical protein